MKTSLLGALLVLQVALVALVGGQVLKARRDADAPALFPPELQRSLDNLGAALNQQRQFNDQLRRQMAEMRAGSSPPSTQGAETAQETAMGPAPMEQEDLPFAGAHAALLKYQELIQQRLVAKEQGESSLSPFDTRIEECRERLLNYGSDALYWIEEETSKQPYETDRDPDLIEALLDQVLPGLSSADRALCFNIARDAILTSTNENSLRMAGARALRQVAPDRWQKEYADVIGLGGRRPKDISLRLALLDAFIESPWEDAVALCQKFLGDASQDLALRTKAVNVMAAQDSPLVERSLRTALFEDHAAEIRLAALRALHQRLGEGDARDRLLQEVLDQDPATMHGSVREMAQRMAKPDETAGSGSGT